MSRAGVVVNPTKVDVAALAEHVGRACAEHGWPPPQVRETTERDPGLAVTRELLEAGVDVVLVAGGDGTVRAVAQVLAGTGTPLVVVPSGTGNLLARNLDLPLDVEPAVEAAFTGRTRRLDLGLLHDGADGQVFAIMAGAGFDAAMMRDAPDGLKSAVGWPAYLVGAARSLRRRRVDVDLVMDGGAPLRRRVRTVLVGNVGQLQGGIELLPDADPGDGVLDVCVVAPRTLLDWLAVARLVGRGRRDPQRRVERFRARTVAVRLRREQPRQLDGELVDPGLRLDVEVVPGALTLRVPVAGADGSRQAADGSRQSTDTAEQSTAEQPAPGTPTAASP